MAMSYSSQKLTHALQRVVEKENAGSPSSEGFTASLPEIVLAEKASPAVGRFLRERARYHRESQKVNIGRY
jgi:hypothetical protein